MRKIGHITTGARIRTHDQESTPITATSDQFGIFFLADLVDRVVHDLGRRF